MSLPLLTKLSGLTSVEPPPETKDAILQSIQSEISRLFDTRSFKKPEYASKLNILDYGIIDHIFEEFTDELETSRAENYINRMVEHFEPRASNVDVNVLKKGTESISLEIYFTFVFDSIREEVNFTIDASKLY